MSIVTRRAGTLLAALLLVLLVAPGGASQPVRADDPDVNDAITEQERMEAELARQRSQLADLRREQTGLTASLAQLTADLDRVGFEIGAAVRELERLSRALAKSRLELASYRRQIASLEVDLDAVADDIIQTRAGLASREALLEEHLRVAYEQSQTSLLEVLLSTDSFSQASSQLSYMMTLSDEDERLADEIRRTRERLEIRQRTLRDGRSTLAALLAAEAERAAALDEQQRQADEVRATLEAYEARLEALKADQEAQYAASVANAMQTEELIAAQQRALEGQAALVERLKEEADKLDIAYRGRFAWPEQGDFMVTQEFGHTAYNPHHTGIDLSYHAPRCGGPIYAAADGVVLADGRPNLAYGDTAIGVVIGNSQRLQTWYWHLSGETVDVGQEVATGDVIGYEGATGMATGCHLHFQVMFDGDPVNPREYLP